jgi:hypothetical protein
LFSGGIEGEIGEIVALVARSEVPVRTGTGDRHTIVQLDRRTRIGVWRGFNLVIAMFAHAHPVMPQ